MCVGVSPWDTIVPNPQALRTEFTCCARRACKKPRTLSRPDASHLVVASKSSFLAQGSFLTAFVFADSKDTFGSVDELSGEDGKRAAAGEHDAESPELMPMPPRSAVTATLPALTLTWMLMLQQPSGMPTSTVTLKPEPADLGLG